MAEKELVYHDDDISREGLSGGKIKHALNLLRSGFNHAIAKVSFYDLVDIPTIENEFNKKIRFIITDIDECAAPHHGEILPRNASQILKWANEKILVIIYSNMKATNRYDELIENGKGYVFLHKSKHAKPQPEGFEECVKLARDGIDEGIGPENGIMIGDNTATDGGSTLAGIDFVRVDPIKTRGEKFSLKRFFQKKIRSLWGWISDRHDKKHNRKVLHDEDFPTYS